MQTLKLVAPTEQREEDKITIRYAETDQDVCAIHQFLLVVAKPAMRVPVDPIQSLMEIIRVTKDYVAIMAEQNGHLVGTMGVISAPWWYNPCEMFMADRWDFVLPQLQHTEVHRMMLAEANTIAEQAGLEFIHQGKIRGKHGKLMMMPRSSRADPDIVRSVGD